MRRYRDEVDQLLNTLNRASGIGAMCFDTQLNTVACCPDKNIVYDFTYLGMNQITKFLSEAFSGEPEKNHIFYTYVLEKNFICNISFLIRDGEYLGALVTEPVLVKKLEQAEIESLLTHSKFSLKERRKLLNILLKTPVIPYNRIISIGNVLNSLTQTFFIEKPTLQVLCGASKEASDNLQDYAKKSEFNVEEAERYSCTAYKKILETVKSGDTEGLLSFMNQINLGYVPKDQLQNSDFVRSLKNSFIKVSALGFYSAIEANAPYDQMADLWDDFIRQSEILENINNIHDLMKKTLLSFTRAVSAEKDSQYSKPVRQVLEYIQTHYAEKITLEKLAEHTNLSTFYLSNLIKKETGFILMDNINKIRIEKSKKLLLNMNISILDVAQRVGFSYQNHFATIFRKFTGFSPSEYRKFLGQEQYSKTGDSIKDKLFPAFIQQVYNKISMFSDMYDIARIVDPINRKSWVIQSKTTDILAETCYSFWNRNESCENCICIRAYLEKDTFLKIEHQKDKTFLVLAAPKITGENTYIVEILKDISEKLLLENKLTQNLYADFRVPVTAGKDELTGLYSRRYIDEKLPIFMRRSILEKKPLSIILSTVNGLDLIKENYGYTVYDKILQEFAGVISNSFRNNEDWAGRYTGNILLTVLYNTEHKNALKVSERIKGNFKQTLFGLDDEIQTFLTVSCGIKTVSDDINDVENLIKLAFMDLHSDKD